MKLIKQEMKGNNMEESNLTSSSMSNEATPHDHVSSSSSSSINGNDHNLTPHPIIKKKRNLPGHPEANAEVIALSPKTLLAKNRYMCEVCNRGFQREQNLQLHRRGHNLPWNLKKNKNKKKNDDDDDVNVIRKKVYVCPETKCVHHNPARALGDLTGIKKHFSRKHCEKIWKCDRCGKKYAVQSDCKAHSKICGTKQYTCQCGTLFSRRDSFITHRAFCDALGLQPDNNNPVLQSPNNYNPIPHHQTQIQIHSKFGCISDKFQFPIKKEHHVTSRSEIPPLLSPMAVGPFFSAPPVDYPNPNPTTTVPTMLLPSPTGPQHGHVTTDGLPSSCDDEIVDNGAGTVTGGGIKAAVTVTDDGGGSGREQVFCCPFGVQGFEDERWRVGAAIDDDEFCRRNYSGDGMTTATRDFLGLGETNFFSFGIEFINNHMN